MPRVMFVTVGAGAYEVLSPAPLLFAFSATARHMIDTAAPRVSESLREYGRGLAAVMLFALGRIGTHSRKQWPK